MQTAKELVELANAGDVAAGIKLSVQRVSETEAEPIGYERLRVIPSKPKERRILQNVRRRLSDVPQALLETFTELAAGDLPWPLYLYGGVGTGKTYAALSFSDVVERVDYFTLEELCNSVMDGKRDPWRGSRAWGGDPAMRLLIIDELGERERVGDLQYTTLKGAIDYREFHWNRVGIYISNLTPDQLAELYDDRIASRLTSGTAFKLGGPDRRNAK